jgi:hypothetical protein
MVDRRRRQLPPWLVGLLVAALVFAIVLFLLDALGYGDDPVIEGALAVIRY